MRSIFKVLFLLTVFLLSVGLDAYAESDYVKIAKSTVFNLYDKPNPPRKIIGAVYPHAKYRVIEKTLSYYKIRLSESLKGWVYLSDLERETFSRGSSVITLDTARNVRKLPKNESEIVGVANPTVSYPVLDRKIHMLKLQLPDLIEGWVFYGANENPNVNFVKDVKKKPVSTQPTNNIQVIVDSRKGWQSFNFEKPVKQIQSITGYWSVDYRLYDPVSYEGHKGKASEALKTWETLKFDQDYSFGTLLFQTETGEVINVQGNRLFDPPVQFVRLRINDRALEDNSGYQVVIFQ